MILELCKDKDWDWKSHIESVVKYSKLLAKKLDADEEVCEISAWLHDINKLEEGLNSKEHHIKGAKRSVEILKGFSNDQELIKKVEHCILTHSNSKDNMPKSKEAKIVASADGLSHYENFFSLAYLVYNIEKKDYSDGKNWLIQKYQKTWGKLIPEAKEIAKSRYEAIKLILGEQN